MRIMHITRHHGYVQLHDFVLQYIITVIYFFIMSKTLIYGVLNGYSNLHLKKSIVSLSITIMYCYVF